MSNLNKQIQHPIVKRDHHILVINGEFMPCFQRPEPIHPVGEAPDLEILKGTIVPERVPELPESIESTVGKALGIIPAKTIGEVVTDTRKNLRKMAEETIEHLPEQIDKVNCEPLPEELGETSNTAVCDAPDGSTATTAELTYDEAVINYMAGNDEPLTESAMKYFPYPDEAFFIRAASIYWNNSFLNAYARHKDHPEEPIDKVLAHDIPQLEAIMEACKSCSPYSVAMMEIKRANPEVFTELSGAYSPEKLNEALRRMMTTSPGPLINITKEEAAELEKKLTESITAKCDPVTSAELRPTMPIDVSAVAMAVTEHLSPAPPASQPKRSHKKKKK